MKYSFQVLPGKGVILVEELPRQNSIEVSFKLESGVNSKNIQIALRLKCDPTKLSDYFARQAYDRVEELLHESLKEVLQFCGNQGKVATTTSGLGSDFLNLMLYPKGTYPEERYRILLALLLGRIGRKIKELNEQRPEPPPPSDPNPYRSPQSQ